eukprot:2717144-Prymnesium_polylepis.2
MKTYKRARGVLARRSDRGGASSTHAFWSPTAHQVVPELLTRHPPAPDRLQPHRRARLRRHQRAALPLELRLALGREHHIVPQLLARHVPP